jgi:cytochrome P450
VIEHDLGDDLGDDRADITDHDTYVRGVPHATFARLRRDDPVSWWGDAEGGFWAVTRYQDVLAVSRQTELFSSAQGIRLEQMAPDECEARRTMMELDPPDHTRYRRLVSQPFARREVFAYEAAVRSLAREVIADVHDTARFDFVHDVARRLPMRMLGALLGLPDDDGDYLVQRGDALLGNTDPEFTDYVVDQVDTDAYRLLPFRTPVSLELFEYAERALAARRAAPTHDVLSALLRPMADGAHLGDIELKNFFTLLVAAGNDTTRYTMAAGMQALAERPALLERLGREPELIELAVEEVLRWSSVTMHFRRTATRDTELGGRAIRAGDRVVMWFVAANFDEEQFAEPYRFDVARTPNDHVTFGRHSPHLCLGAQLARLELKVLFEELLPRLRSVAVDGPVERLRSNFIAGIKRLPLEVDWR